jgi:hypothetical protein
MKLDPHIRAVRTGTLATAFAITVLACQAVFTVRLPATSGRPGGCAA